MPLTFPPLFIQEGGVSVWKEDLLSSHSDSADKHAHILFCAFTQNPVLTLRCAQKNPSTEEKNIKEQKKESKKGAEKS